MIKKILAMLMGEIQYANSTFEEAFASIAARVEEPWKGFMSGMSERLGELSGQPFAQIWKEQVDKQLKRTEMCIRDRHRSRGMRCWGWESRSAPWRLSSFWSSAIP